MLNIYKLSAKQICAEDTDGGAMRALYKSFCMMHGAPITEAAPAKPPMPPKYEGQVLQFYDIAGFTFKSLAVAQEVADFINSRLTADNAISLYGRQSIDWDMRDFANGVTYSYDPTETRGISRASVETKAYGEEATVKDFKARWYQYKSDKKEYEASVQTVDSNVIVKRAFDDIVQAAFTIVQTHRQLHESLQEYMTLADGNIELAMRFMEKAKVIGTNHVESVDEVKNICGYAERLAKREFTLSMQLPLVPVVHSMTFIYEVIRKRLADAGFPYEEYTPNWSSADESNA